LAFLDPEYNTLIALTDMPVLDGDINPHQLRAIIRAQMPDLAVIEHVHSHPKEGVSSVWRFASAFTVAKTVVTLLDIPTMLVTPAKWKKAMSVKGGPEGKEQCRRLAIEKFPTDAELFARKKDHGRAEAALLAMYASMLPTIRNYDEATHDRPI
jgi:Holliday junction resolvasome RuvABC endonuclease subunit